MRTTVILLLGLVGLTVATTAQPIRADHYLDIVGFPLTPPPPRSGPLGLLSGGGSRSSHQPPPDIQLKVTLTSLDRLTYETGDDVVYEVIIENVGRRPVILPWSPDVERFIGTSLMMPPPGLRAIVGLEGRDHIGKVLARLELRGLYGSQDIDGSLETLQPRETALIRVPGFWRMSEYEMRALLNEPNGVVQVGAVYMLTDQQILVRSSNSIEVTLLDRLRRFR